MDAHPAATPYLPIFVTSPGGTDWLFVLMSFFLIGAVLGVGVFFFWLHSLPERMVHHKVQFDIVAVLALLSLFTHIHAFWVAALILALIEFPDISLPDFSKSFSRMASSLETIAQDGKGDREVPVESGRLTRPELEIHSDAKRGSKRSI